MTENKPQSQTERNKKWQEKNRERTRYLSRRSTARSFIRKDATLEDIEELETIIKERKDILKNEGLNE